MRSSFDAKGGRGLMMAVVHKPLRSLRGLTFTGA